MSGGDMRIWKYPLSFTDEQRHSAPRGARVLHVGEQDGILCVWMLVDPSAAFVMRRFRVYGTGHRIGNSEGYIGTAHCEPFVWHVFDGGEE